jgi:hypothetical protein
MNEKFKLGGEVIVDNILKQRDIETTGSEVGDKEERAPFPSELHEFILSGLLVHSSPNSNSLKSSMGTELI